MKNNPIKIAILFSVLSIFCSCHTSVDYDDAIVGSIGLPSEEYYMDEFVFDIVEVQEDVAMKDYFDFIDGIVENYRFYNPMLTEHVLVQANDWIIYALECTDYYTKVAKGEFVYDQGELIIIEKGEIILIPNDKWIIDLLNEQRKTRIEVNIPEYKLRIYQEAELLNTISVRVGRNESTFLATANRLEDLRTKTGTGYIHEIERDPIYINPVDGHQYTSTLRDDNRRTLLPQIPFLHPKINGYLNGQVIHPTTNKNTLGKSYSNGCIGLSEGDMWYLYYYAPVGTAIELKYELDVINTNGDSIRLPDIYQDSLHYYASGIL